MPTAQAATPRPHGTGTSWTETGNTNNRPARTTAALEDKGAIAANTWLEYNVTGAITGSGTYASSSPPAPLTEQTSTREAPFRPEPIVTKLVRTGDTTPPNTTITTVLPGP